MESQITALRKSPELKPFIKWAGGKGQLLNELRKAYPKGLGKTVTKYAEPFVGGGAVLFDLLSHYALREIYISDINAELINAYKTVRDNPDELISLLYKMQSEYLNADDRKGYYAEARARFNHLKVRKDADSPVEKAALFIFLNKTCFNGLYRVNKKGLFNVPMGNYKNPGVCDEENLRNISCALKNVRIECADYKSSADFIDGSTFVYFDPPYRPLSKTASFTAYTESIFNDSSQAELALFISGISKKGAFVVASNSDPRNLNESDDFFEQLYKKHKINRVEAARAINCNGSSRGKISELLISNF